jgi:hypothetical protein
MVRRSSFQWVLIGLSALVLCACTSDLDPDRPAEQGQAPLPTFVPPSKVAIVTAGDADEIWAGITAIPNTDVSKVSPGDYETGNKSQWALVVFDNYQPKEPPKVPAFFFNTIPPDSTVRIVRDSKGVPAPVRADFRFNVDTVDDKSPLMKDVFLKDVQIAKAIKLSSGSDWKVVASYGGTPVILANKPASGPAEVILPFNVEETTWTLHFPHDFPIFLTNAFQWMTAK